MELKIGASSTATLPFLKVFRKPSAFQGSVLRAGILMHWKIAMNRWDKIIIKQFNSPLQTLQGHMYHLQGRACWVRICFILVLDIKKVQDDLISDFDDSQGDQNYKGPMSHGSKIIRPVNRCFHVFQLSSFNQNTAQTNSQTPSEHWRIRKLVVRKPANRKYKPREARGSPMGH